MDVSGGDVTNGYILWIFNKRCVHSLHRLLFREISEHVIKW